MIRTVGRVRYDTNEISLLGSYRIRSASGNRSGTTYMMKSRDGRMFVHTEMDGAHSGILDFRMNTKERKSDGKDRIGE